MADLPAPVRVAPFIKFCRWSLLLAGVTYGATRNSMLSKRENARRAELERTRPEREAKLKAEKEKLSREEMENLGKELGQSIM